MTQASVLAQLGSAGVSQGFKNRIINGAMVIDQRNAGASVTANDGTYSVDRWKSIATANGKFSMQQNAGSVTPPTGFTNYLGCTSTAATSVGSSDFYQLRQVIEGFNFADCGWGTANAKTVTLSFWVRSSLTGTHGGSVFNAAGSRTYPFSFTINSANTWEFETITIAGDTTGTWVGATNGGGLQVGFNLGTGSSLSGTANAWSGSTFMAPTGAVQIVATNGATFYITGVQLEVGTTATEFEVRPYGTELQLCQRYYQRIDGFYAVGFNSTTMSGSIGFPVEMRASPSLSVSGALETTDFVAANYTQSSGSVSISGAGARVSARGVMADFGNFTSITNYRVYGNLPQVNRLILSSEL